MVCRGIGEQLQLLEPFFMPLEGVHDGRCGKALMHEERQGGHFECIVLGLSRPVEERRRHGLEFHRRGLGRFQIRRIEDLADQGLPLFPGVLAVVPGELRVQGAVVPVGGRWPGFSILCLGSHFGSHQ